MPSKTLRRRPVDSLMATRTRVEAAFHPQVARDAHRAKGGGPPRPAVHKCCQPVWPGRRGRGARSQAATCSPRPDDSAKRFHKLFRDRFSPDDLVILGLRGETKGKSAGKLDGARCLKIASTLQRGLTRPANATVDHVGQARGIA